MYRQSIPTQVRQVLDLFKAASNTHHSPFAGKVVSHFTNVSDLTLRKERWEILRKNWTKGKTIKNGDMASGSSNLNIELDTCPDNLHLSERELYVNPIRFGPNELKDTKSFFMDLTSPHHGDENALFGSHPGYEVGDSVFVRDIISIANSFYQPLSEYPKNKSGQNTFHYYLQSLILSPLVIFFQQKRRLFNMESLEHWNQDMFDMEQLVREMNKNVKGNKSINPFLFSKLTHPDNLQLALKAYNIFEREKLKSFLNKSVRKMNWKELSDKSNGFNNDELAMALRENSFMKLLNRDTGQIEQDCNQVSVFCENILDKLRTNSVGSIDEVVKDIPYDLEYSSLYSITMHEYGLRNNTDFSALNQLLKETPMNIVAARILLNNTKVKKLLQNLSDFTEPSDSIRYDDILKLAHNKSKDFNDKDISSVFSNLATRGLTHPSLNKPRDALYLTNPSIAC